MSSAELNYAEVGATARELPAGYDHLRRSRHIGHGREVFEQASRELLAWDLHRRSGLTVEATGPVTEGRDVTLGLRWGPVRISAPCRVLRVRQEQSLCEFAYETLRGHPESGEELFRLTLDAAHDVALEIIAFSSRTGGGPGSVLR